MGVRNAPKPIAWLIFFLGCPHASVHANTTRGLDCSPEFPPSPKIELNGRERYYLHQPNLCKARAPAQVCCTRARVGNQDPFGNPTTPRTNSQKKQMNPIQFPLCPD